MKPRDVFKIIVATIGLIGFCYGTIYLIDSLLFALGLFQLQHSAPGYYAARGVLEMILGILFMKGFPPFVDLAFPEAGTEIKLPEEPDTGRRCVSCQSPINDNVILCPKCGWTQPS